MVFFTVQVLVWSYPTAKSQEKDPITMKRLWIRAHCPNVGGLISMDTLHRKGAFISPMLLARTSYLIQPLNTWITGYLTMVIFQTLQESGSHTVWKQWQWPLKQRFLLLIFTESIYSCWWHEDDEKYFQLNSWKHLQKPTKCSSPFLTYQQDHGVCKLSSQLRWEPDLLLLPFSPPYPVSYTDLRASNLPPNSKPQNSLKFSAQPDAGEAHKKSTKSAIKSKAACKGLSSGIIRQSKESLLRAS